MTVAQHIQATEKFMNEKSSLAAKTTESNWHQRNFRHAHF
jgi:hypothetical protein